MVARMTTVSSGLPSYSICSKGGRLVCSSCYCGWKKKLKFFPGSPHSCLLTSHQADWVPCPSWRSLWIRVRWAELLKSIRDPSGDEEEVTSPPREGVSAQEGAALRTKIWVLFLGEDGEVEAGESSAKMVSIPIQFSYCSASQSCPTLCNPMDCSMPGFLVLNHLLESAKIHVHWVGDAIQPSHPPLPPSPPAFNLSQHQGLFQGWFPLGFTGLISLLSRGPSRVISSTMTGKHQFFDVQPSLWSNSHNSIQFSRLRQKSQWQCLISVKMPGSNKPSGIRELIWFLTLTYHFRKFMPFLSDLVSPSVEWGCHLIMGYAHEYSFIINCF